MKNIHLRSKKYLQHFENIFKCMFNNEVMNLFFRRIQFSCSFQIL